MVIAFVACLLVGVIMMIFGKRHGSYNDWGLAKSWGLALTLIGIVLTFVAWPIIYIDSYMNLMKIEVFHDANRAAYETTIETTRDAIYFIAKDPTLRIDVENLSQSTNWSERLAEFRDAVVTYNTCIYKLRRYNSTFALSAMFANPRPDLKLIVLEK